MRDQSPPRLEAMVFFNVDYQNQDIAQQLGITKTKSGKWAMPIYDKSGTNTKIRLSQAERIFGRGTWWTPR